jgi:hypothetical protein
LAVIIILEATAKQALGILFPQQHKCSTVVRNFVTLLGMKLIPLFAITFLSCLGSLGQGADTGFTFLRGIYLSSPRITMPWGTKFSEISKYGNPKIYCSTKTNTKVLWDSVYIFDSIKVNFRAFYFRCFERHEPTHKLVKIYGVLDSINISSVKNILTARSKSTPTLFKHSHQYTYHWIIDDCYVNLGFNKRSGAFLEVETKNKVYWE